MNNNLSKVASILALVIGALAIFAGGKVILGILPDYYVVDWLPIYNFTVGVITIFFTSILIWKNSPYALPVAISTFCAHGLVMIILQTAYRDVVASNSIVAMTVRIVVWLLILALLLVRLRIKRTFYE